MGTHDETGELLEIQHGNSRLDDTQLATLKSTVYGKFLVKWKSSYAFTVIETIVGEKTFLSFILNTTCNLPCFMIQY